MTFYLFLVVRTKILMTHFLVIRIKIFMTSFSQSHQNIFLVHTEISIYKQLRNWLTTGIFYLNFRKIVNKSQNPWISQRVFEVPRFPGYHGISRMGYPYDPVLHR